MKGWTHLHSVLGGCLLGVALSRNGDWIVAALLVMFLLGLVAGRFWHFLAELGGRILLRLHGSEVTLKAPRSRYDRHPW